MIVSKYLTFQGLAYFVDQKDIELLKNRGKLTECKDKIVNEMKINKKRIY